jgi:Integrase zinc binding domain
MPDEMRLKNRIMKEAQETFYAIHPGETKMYQNLKNYIWWRNMRHEVAQFVARCLVCQKVKTDQHKTPGLLQPLQIEENQRKFDHITMNFMAGLPKASKRCDVIWVIIVNLTKVAHFYPIPLWVDKRGDDSSVHYQVVYATWNPDFDHI